jgi:metal-sulfur cluster biosynthetic enzyme
MPTEEQVVDALKEIIDPHTNMSVYDMGLISDINVTDDDVSLTFRPTSPFCPLGIHLALNIKRRLAEIQGTKKAEVRVTGHIQEEQINRQLQSS